MPIAAPARTSALAGRLRRALHALLLAALLPLRLAAQEATPRPFPLWPAVATAGLATLAFVALDEDVRDSWQRNRTSGRDDVARQLERFGQVEVLVPVPVGLALAGLIAHDDRLLRTAGRSALGIVLAEAVVQPSKFVLGRHRPNAGDGAYTFSPFSKGDASMPSGHTAAAFALATVLADDIHNTWATVGLYTLAGGTGLARMELDAHWLSDVLVGAGIGIAAGKLADGKWSLFGVKTPRVLRREQRTVVSFSIPVRF